VHLLIRGHHLPGRRFVAGDGVVHDDVHVGVQERALAIGLVAGDAASARWDLDVRVVAGVEGGLDFRGPAVHGRRGERFVYLTWGSVGADGAFTMFRRAKLLLDRIDAALVAAAEQDGRPLVADVDLTDSCGGPRCARLDPPALALSLG
jgi:hypothetical protein